MSKQLEHEGVVNLTVTEVSIIKHRFDSTEGCFEVKVVAGRKGEGGEPEFATAYLPISGDFLPANLQRDGYDTEAGKTFHTLANFGVPNGGMELGKAEEMLKGKILAFFGKRNNGGYLNYYINTGKAEEATDANDAAKQVAAMYGSTNGAAPAAKAKPEIDETDKIPMDGLDDDPFKHLN